MFLSVFLSGEVVATIAGDKSVVNMNLYRSNQSQQIQIWESSNSTEEAAEDLLVREKTLMLGLVVSMVASQTWQLAATYLGWPVSGTHTIISGELSLSTNLNTSHHFSPPWLYSRGEWNTGSQPWQSKSFQWIRNIQSIISIISVMSSLSSSKVVYGLLVSPAFSLVLSFAIYSYLYRLALIILLPLTLRVLRFAVKSGRVDRISSKVSYCSCVFLIMMAITFTFASLKQSPAPEGWNKKGFGLLIGASVGILSALLFYTVLPSLVRMKGEFKLTFDICTKKRREVEGIDNPTAFELQEDGVVQENVVAEETNTEENISDDTAENDESLEVKRIFRPLQILAACFGALTHGSNDVGNCIGPLVTVWYIYQVTHDVNLNLLKLNALLSPVHNNSFQESLGSAEQ